ncbi:MAG: hypothetical protein KOO61_10185 [Spirochaetales bacterium]|nr:hypothetical protein [Spirochaetales bacterium]
MQRSKNTPELPPGIAVLVIAAALAANIGLNAANNALSLPFFFDSIGTAVVAATVGLVPGLVVAIGTNALIEVLNGFPWIHLPFAVCGMATAVIIWAFVRKNAFGNIGTVLLVSLLVAFANSILGGVIASFVYGGVTGVGVDYLVTGLVAAGQSIVSAAFWARLPANLFDKTIAVLAAYGAHRYLARATATSHPDRPGISANTR